MWFCRPLLSQDEKVFSNRFDIVRLTQVMWGGGGALRLRSPITLATANGISDRGCESSCVYPRVLPVA